jgi:hypothetical protein
MNKQSLKYAAKYGKWESVDISKVTIKMVNNDSYANPANLLHIAAIHGKLSHVPKHLLNNEGLLLRTELEESVLHIAAREGEFDNIPEELITEENLLKENHEGNSVFHFLAIGDNLERLPKNLRTKKNFLIDNNTGKSPLNCAASLLESLKKEDQDYKRVKKNIKTILVTLKKEDLDDILLEEKIIIKALW